MIISSSSPDPLDYSATSLEELVPPIIVTYRYQVQDGLELVDVSEEESSGEGKEAEMIGDRAQPRSCQFRKLKDKTVYLTK